MTDNVKHSTSYFHEVVAKAFEMFKNGYEPVMETPFQPRRQGSAFVTEYKLVREPLDELTQKLMDHHNLLGQPGAKFSGQVVELKDKSGKVIRVPGIVMVDKISGQVEITEIDDASKILDNPPAPNSRLKSMIEESREVFRELVENTYDENLQPISNEQLTIHEKWEIDDQINFEADEKKKLAEIKSCDKLFTKEQLDAMHWDQLKPMLDQAGIRGRRRANMIRDFLKKQEEEGEG